MLERLLALCTLLLLLSVPLASANAATPSYIELTDAPTITIDWSRGSTQTVTLGGNRELTFVNGQKGGKYMLILKQDATGSRTVTWPASLRWPGGAPQSGGNPASVLTTTANKTDYITFFYDGANYDVLALAPNY